VYLIFGYVSALSLRFLFNRNRIDGSYPEDVIENLCSYDRTAPSKTRNLLLLIMLSPTPHLSHANPIPDACGHDMHVTCALAATHTLLSSRSLWSGTLITLFQPAEERGSGAQAMINSGLYAPDKHACPIPDVVLGQHVFPFRSGTVHTKAGPVMSAADSFRITIFGRGGHGSMPHRCIDPVVIASHIVVRLQSIVSREVPPDETAVVTVGALQAGDTENIISDTAVLKINIRTVSEIWRTRILESVTRIVNAECEIGRCPKPAEIVPTSRFPLTVNDGETVGRLEEAFDKHFGDGNEDGIVDGHKKNMNNVLGSEDFGILATAIGKPYAFWFWGGTDPELWDRYEKEGRLDEVPVNHSPFFAPCVQPTLTVGVDALVVGALTFLGKETAS
jgi:amidohydrolase